MYSFDVFDTLISRTTATPQGIFALMKDRLQNEKRVNGLHDYVIANFVELRIHSEELIRKAGSFQNIEEVTLRDIYDAMSVCGCVDEKQIEYLCQLEETVELANVTEIPKNVRRLKALLEQGEKVVLISDMYLSREIIQKMLLQVDDVLGKLPLYVSSEYGKRKTTGNLYRLVQEKEQVNYDGWIHIGDNMYQDIEVPYSMGIQVELAARAELSDFEKELLDRYGDDSRLQLMIGAAVKAEASGGLKRLEETEKSNKSEIPSAGISSAAFHIGCRYAGPVLYCYAEWLVEQAVKRGIKRLYFIARDSYLVKQITDIILGRKNVDIATSYIYGSRKAWRMPSLSREHYNLYQLILWSHVFRITTLEELASALHMSVQELYGFLPGTFAKHPENNHISNQELEYIAWKLSSNEKFKAYHLQALQKERQLSRQYLLQEIDFTDDNFAFVDVSGGGLTQGCLRELIRDRYGKPIHTFFFKIDRVNLVEGSVTDTFMPGFLENNLTIEMMCRAPHGQTKGYVEKDGKVEPVLEEAESAQLIGHGFYEYEKGIMEFSKLMCEVSMKSGQRVGSMKNILLYLKHVAEEPSQDVLEYFASMPSSESGRGEETIEYAPRLTEADMEAIFLGRTYEPMEWFYKGTDLNYSIMRATEAEKAMMEHYKKEHNGAPGKLYRQKSERNQRSMRERYNSAAFYPVRLLEERLAIYGAGKFGRNLYRKLTDNGEHKIALWVDKNAAACRQQIREAFSAEVQDVSALLTTEYDQIVIAVLDRKLAGTIREELQQLGIAGEKTVWLPSYPYPNMMAEWKSEEIG